MTTFALLAVGLSFYTPRDPTNVRLGDSEATVVALLGRPHEVKGAPWAIARGVNPGVIQVNSGECVREFVYYRQKGGTREQTWRVGFDSEGRVISSYGYRPLRAYAHNLLDRVQSPGESRMVHSIP